MQINTFYFYLYSIFLTFLYLNHLLSVWLKLTESQFNLKRKGTQVP